VSRASQNLMLGVIFWLLGSRWATADPADIRTTLPIAHARPITAAVVLPGAGLIATGAQDGAVKVWETASGLLVSEYRPQGHAPVLGLAADPVHKGWIAVTSVETGGATAALGEPATIRIVDLQTGEVKRQLTGDAGHLLFSSDGRWLSSVAHSLLSVWDLTTGKLWVTLQVDAECVAFGPHDTLLFRRQDHVDILDLETGAVRTLTTGPGGAFALSKDGALLADVGRGELRVWRIADGAALASRFVLNDPRFIYFGDDGSVIAGDQLNSVVAGSSWNLVYRLTPGEWKLEGLAAGESPLTSVSDGGDAVLFGESNGRVQRVRLKDHTASPELGAVAPDVTAVAFSSDERYLAAGLSNGGAAIWEPASNLYRVLDPQRIVPRLPEPTVAESKSGLRYEQDYVSGEGITNAKERDLQSVVGVAFTEPRHLLMAHRSGKVEVVDVTTGQIVQAFTTPASAVLVARGSSARAAVVYDTGVACLGRNHQKPILVETPRLVAKSAAFSRDGKRLLVTGFQSAVEIDCAQGKVLRTLAGPQGPLVYGPAGALEELTWAKPPSSPDTNGNGVYPSLNSTDWRSDLSVAVVGRDDGTVRVWRSGHGAATPLEWQFDGALASLALSADGRVLASASGHGHIALHRMSDGAPLVDLLTLDPQAWLARSAEGRFDGSYVAWKYVRATEASARLEPLEPAAVFDQWYQPQLLADALYHRAAQTPPAPPPSARAPQVELVSPKATFERAQSPPMSSVLALQRETRLAEGKPISVEVFAPAQENSLLRSQNSIHDAQVTLVATVQDAGDGVGECRIFRNRRLVQSVTPKLVDGKAQFSATAPILTGENTLSAYCFSRSGLRSNETEVGLVGAAGLSRPGKAYVLAVGVDKYPALPLKYAVSDAKLALRSLSGSLQGGGGYAKVNSALLTDHNASAAEILHALQILSGAKPPVSAGPLAALGDTRPEDTVFIYFAGHGGGFAGDYRLIAGDGSPVQGRTWGTVSSADIRSVLTPLQAGRVVLIVDACEAGQTLDQVDPRAGPLAGRTLAQLAYDKAIFVISASQSQQAARELPHLGHGVFSYVLFEKALGPAADENHDGVISIREWLDFAQTETPKQLDRESVARGFARPRAELSGHLGPSGAKLDLRSAQTPRAFLPDPNLAVEFVVSRLADKTP
jgi:WD40 repeat protein